MTSQIVALLASAGLVTAGVAATAETRSVSAMPSMTASQVLPGASSIMMGAQVDCSLDQNKDRSECNDEGAAAHGNSGLIIGGLVALVGAAGLLVALKKDSNG